MCHLAGNNLQRVVTADPDLCRANWGTFVRRRTFGAPSGWRRNKRHQRRAPGARPCSRVGVVCFQRQGVLCSNPRDGPTALSCACGSFNLCRWPQHGRRLLQPAALFARRSSWHHNWTLMVCGSHLLGGVYLQPHRPQGHLNRTLSYPNGEQASQKVWHMIREPAREVKPTRLSPARAVLPVRVSARLLVLGDTKMLSMLLVLS